MTNFITPLFSLREVRVPQSKLRCCGESFLSLMQHGEHKHHLRAETVPWNNEGLVTLSWIHLLAVFHGDSTHSHTRRSSASFVEVFSRSSMFVPQHFVISLLPAVCREIRLGVCVSSRATVQHEASQPRGEVTSAGTKERARSVCLSFPPKITVSLC